MLRQPESRAARTTASGGNGSPAMPPSLRRGAWEICQFWQKPQRKLQPGVAMDMAFEPGRKW